MKKILNMTNGYAAVKVMLQANIPGEILPWQDVLNEGPIPENLSLEELSKVRAEFIVRCGWGEVNTIKKEFTARDEQLRSCNEYSKIILWFEHDLYDQLQILQILDWFHGHPVSDKVGLSIICTDQYLGSLTADEMSGLFKYEEQITAKHLNLASTFWAAFRSSSPKHLFNLLETDSSALPFLRGSILRLLEEYPATFNGLSRTAQQALTILDGGEKGPVELFIENQKFEESIFMGDSSFWLILNDFLQSNPPLLISSAGIEIEEPVTPEQSLTITTAGQEVLKGKRNWLNIVDCDKWIGGVHLKAENIWCWDSASGSIMKSNL